MTFIQTFSGKLFSFVAPDPDSVDINDIAVHLSRLNRFTGATRWPYSVAQHSLHVMQICRDASPNDHIAHLWGLLHDAHEAYVGDMSTPLHQTIKLMLPRFTPDPIEALKDSIDKVIAERFGIDWSDILSVRPFVKRADMIALATEKAQLMEHVDWMTPLPEPCSVELLQVSACNVEWLFKAHFEKCLSAYRASKVVVREAAE